MSAQRARSAVEASHRSIHPNIPGVPWWAALVIAITATAAGYAIDAGHKDLTHVFAACYIAGCVAAVLAVRQDGVFTAIIQPPLILFCAVPGAYWMFHGHKIGSLKDLLINCGYPLIERFPLMLGTAGVVLLIGLARWYFGKSQATAAAPEDDAATAGPAGNSFLGAIGEKLNSLLGLGAHDGDAEEAPPTGSKRTREAGRPAKAASRTGRTTRGGRSARPGRAHSRHARPPLEDERDPRDARAERPRRRRQAPPHDFDPADPPRPRRRPRPDTDHDGRQPPRETRREPRTRRNPYDRPGERQAPRGSRFDGYDPYEPYEPRRRRATPPGNGSDTTHHPISQVRYRGSGPAEDAGPERRRRAPRSFPAESWEYEG
ncbi:hypothetical protein A5696_20145 [Mycobacterium sp. E2699]|uniref:DUF6542 domain-containing protein n=1 Tax=Mycobacterium sp. E2699 TaxID=1834137 RepID=UPI0008017703|nr:DUF6542 domain-containing protein [Mycobacterium sp. E2699]OBH08244.1 hypothetical protein A5696_20145 [Mycobacterium sp. E2699]